YLTEESSHYLRRLHLADLPWALTCPLESPFALEIRSTAGATLRGATSGDSPQAATAMAAETANDDNTATAAFADNVFEAAAPVIESA
ncbi:hypothetical protein K523DRAFT_219266, partial [Schizophyllum commune Tattone D]